MIEFDESQKNLYILLITDSSEFETIEVPLIRNISLDKEPQTKVYFFKKDVDGEEIKYDSTLLK